MADSTATFRVERSIDIDAPPDTVFGFLADFHRWQAWSPWEAIDPTMYRGFSGPEAGVGSMYEWSGNRKAGAGRMVILEAEAPRSLEIALDFIKPFKSRSTATFALDATAGGSHVTWLMEGPKTFMTRVMGVFMSMDKAIGPDFERGLAKLKDVAEG